MKELVTIKEIARQLQVSVSTVSRALRNNPRIGLKTRESVQALAGQLKYSPNAAALNFRSGKSGIIGVVLPEIRENFFSEALNGIEAIALNEKYLVALYQSRDSFEREKQILSALTANRVEGILLSAAKESQSFQHVRDVIAQQIPVVLFDRIPPGVKTHQVGCDVKNGAYQATKWLAAQGSRRIALLNGPPTLVACDDRYEGYITALVENDLPVDSILIKRVDLTPEDTAKKMAQLLALDPRPDAVLAFNDYVALDAMRICRNQGMMVNKDISFASFANLPMNMYLEQPPLVSVEQHPFEIGQKAAEMLIRSIQSGTVPGSDEYERVIIDSHLKVWQ
ncbi:LacI family DNA-binding transcriptional regulator [Dyadobacter fermentans]|uniref:LacI family DNA-binding transcriptional regulator n=1 Tax=Dyadobacter fermentans TaxID=94254 RepID=UPI001CC051A2|nr:LacI family DNA-binding transcriptional regulator [Dyadobacter fermentans]MBZ1357883.1 LacI family transcriptional regulator [Dyadobacter fermentans]